MRSGGATLQVLHSTLSGNSATAAGGGIYNDGAITRLGSTVFNASAIFNASGMIDSLGYNLIDSGDGSGSLTAIGDQYQYRSDAWAIAGQRRPYVHPHAVEWQPRH